MSKSNPESNKKWLIDPSQKTSHNFAPYLRKKLLTCLELELDYKEGCDDCSIGNMKEEFGANNCGISANSDAPCPVCNKLGCWDCEPPKTIRLLKYDITISGKEILVQGSNMTGDEFVKRFPFENVRKYFEPTQQDSCHCHILTSSHEERIPVQVGQNSWQLFRNYYPALAYIFGNFKGHLLRGNWAKWDDYKTSASNFHNWWNAEKVVNTYSTPIRYYSVPRREKHGFTFYSSDVDAKEKFFTYFDLEIRTPDATTDPEQLVGIRALSKGMVLRGADLASRGVIEIPPRRWARIRPLIEEINHGIEERDVKVRERDCWGQMVTREQRRQFYDYKVEGRRGRELKQLAIDLYSETRKFFTPYERQCVWNCIQRPVRDRTPNKKVKPYV